MVLCATVLLTGCSWDDVEELPSDTGPTVASVDIDPRTLELGGVGDSAILLATARDRLGDPMAVSSFAWSVSDPSVAAIDSVGLVRAIGLGSVAVTAATEGVEGTASVEVDPAFATERACGECHALLRGDHTNLGFSAVSCWECHNPAGESHRQFPNHHVAASGGYELLGVHTQLECGACHVKSASGLRFSPADAADCVACHQSDYDAQHGGSGFPTTCALCHTPTTWADATIDHEAVSGGFELVGAHVQLACTSCHEVGSYAPLFPATDETDCVACHQSDYDGQHAGTGYPTACRSCHSTSDWSGATFDHGVVSGGFDLLGRHTTLPCTSCHDAVTGQPLFTPVDETDCAACHQSDYDQQHQGSGYPTSCLTCHDGSAWTGASFDHDADYFPIYSGDHAGEWQSCNVCHTQRGDFTVFTCFNCHRHNQNDMDDTHSEIQGYAYDPPTCLGCHPDGTKP
jgi:hypothetical protein